APHAPDASTVEACVATELFWQGRVAEAVTALDRLAVHRTSLNLRARIATTALRGRVASWNGHHHDAVALLTQTRELSDAVDDPCLAGDVLFQLAIVLHDAGFHDRAASVAVQALERFTSKGATLLAERVRDWLSTVAIETT